MTAQMLSTNRGRGLLVLLSFFLLACGCGNPFSRTPTNPNLAGADFGEVVTSGAIGEGASPQDQRNEFRTSDPIIYVVAQVDRVANGTTVFARWIKDGQPYEDSDAITANQDYTNTYLEFHLQPTQGGFQKGNYEVQIYVNGNPGPKTEFTIK